MMKQDGISKGMISVHIQRRMSEAEEAVEAGEIPDGYIYIGDKMFPEQWESARRWLLPAGCRVVGKQAFEGCQFQKASGISGRSCWR